MCTFIHFIKPRLEAMNSRLTHPLMTTFKKYRALKKSIVCVWSPGMWLWLTDCGEHSPCSLSDDALMSVCWCRLRSYHYVDFTSNSHWKHMGIIHFQEQWTRYGGWWIAYISYLFWTLRMSSLYILGPFPLYPLSVHHTYFLQETAVLVNFVSNVTLSPSVY